MNELESKITLLVCIGYAMIRYKYLSLGQLCSKAHYEACSIWRNQVL